MTKDILKLIRKTNKKSFKRNSDYQIYPYVCAYNSKIVGYVHKRGKTRAQLKRCSFGPEKYIIRVSDKGIEFEITHLNIKIYKTEPVPNNIFPLEHLIFEGKEMSKDEHFNISMMLANVPNPEEIQLIRNIMMRKDTRYNRIYMYMSKDWMS